MELLHIIKLTVLIVFRKLFRKCVDVKINRL